MLKRILTTLIIGCTFLIVGYATANFDSYDKHLNVYYTQLNSDARKQVECLAENIYYEAATEPQKGQIAVAFVTMNRTKSGYFPDTICDVVRQRNSQACQFTWYCDRNNLTKKHESLYNDIRKLAVNFYANHEKMRDPTHGALFYHADYVQPKWNNMVRTATIGRHIFYNRKDFL